MTAFRNYLFSFIILSILGCEKESNPVLTSATITGIDLTLSACSGGYIIKLDDGSATYQWDPKWTEMEDFGISDIPASDYPIKIKMDFKVANTKCALFDAFIDITQLTIE